ncbi:MAG: glycoside hydrolase family 95 protein [Bacteroidaceae bacterium]|nr:glycoside hydrolase family 95 protein [Bacteroidaceae bacterium]
MRKLTLLMLTLCCTLLSAATKPSTSTASNPLWYFIQFNKENVVMEAQGSGAEVKTALGTGKDAQLWRLEGNDNEGYHIYSKSGMTLYVTSPEKNNGFFSASTSASNNTLFDIKESTVQGSAGFLLAPHGTDVFANQWQGAGVGKRLGLWDADAGCVLNFVAEADFDFSYQPAPTAPTEVSIKSLTTAPDEPLTMWYKTPATNWTTEALPIGNGDMGAMIFGGVAQDRVQFNHKTFWRGGSGANNLGTYLNFGELYVINHAAEAVTDYQRRLNLREAVAEVEYKDSKASYKREYIASYPDGVMAVRYTASEGTPLDLELQFINGYGERAQYTTTGAAFSGKVDNGLNYRGAMRLQQQGGTVTSDKDGIRVEGASSLIIYIVCGTDYSTTLNSHMTGKVAELQTSQEATLDAACGKGYEAIRESHISDYQSLFERVEFSLTGAKNAYPTGDLLQKTSIAASMKMVDMLVFQYGRYLTIASSRGVDLPSNLQGIWCKDGNATSGAVWASDIHTNVNVQMNYWPAESTNLSECHMPLLNFLYNESQRQGGGWQQNARNLGVQRGWVVNTASNIFGGSSSYKVGKYSCANAWLCSHLWQHYAYTRDRKFLKEKALPVMKSACEFWFDRLKVASDGSLECPNEYSPEQGRVQDATAHSQQLVTQLFIDMQSLIEELGEESGCDATFQQTLADKLAKIDRGLRVDKDGLLREWKYQENTPNKNADTDYFADDEQNVWKGHRHTSHLMGLYPHFEIDPGKDTEIFNAAKASLLDRGDKATGWARAWRISLWSRCRDAQKTYTTLRGFAHRTTKTGYDWDGGLYDNLMDAHATSVFQIEGNFGATAGIAEMLLQSRPDSLVLLPALPTQWAEGSIRGLKAIGNFEVGMNWESGKLKTLSVRSLAGQPLTLAYPGIHTAHVVCSNGQKVEAHTAAIDRLSLDTEAGQEYLISWEGQTEGILSSIATPAAQANMYDLQGRQLRNRHNSTIYIQNNNKKL